MKMKAIYSANINPLTIEPAIWSFHTDSTAGKLGISVFSSVNSIRCS